jgi:hypothetical protein
MMSWLIKTMDSMHHFRIRIEFTRSCHTIIKINYIHSVGDSAYILVAAHCIS